MPSFNSLVIRTRSMATPQREVAAVEPVAQEPPSSRSPSTETSLMELPVRSHPAVRRAQAPVSAATKPKAKKYASAAPMLKKKGNVNKTRSQVKKTRKIKTPAQRALANRVNAGVNQARMAIMAKEDAAFDNIYTTFMASMDGSAADDSAFVQSIDDTLSLLWAPLELERVQATYSRHGGHVMREFYVEDRIQMLKESIKKNKLMIADYWGQWQEMQDDFLQFGVNVFGKNSFASTEDAEAAMNQSFIQRMGALRAEHTRLVQDLRIEMRTVGEDLMADQEAAEEEFEISVRNAKSMVFEYLL